MKKESRTQQNKESASNKQPVDPRDYPLARDSRGAAGRADIRPPRQSNRPAVRGSRNQTHGR